MDKRTINRLARRERILEIAAQSFLENGYDRTTMSAIATHLGGSKGTLWKYFQSKEQLFEDVFQQRTASFREEIASILTPAPDVRLALLRYSRRFMEKTTSEEAVALFRLVIAESVRFPEVGRIFRSLTINLGRLGLARFIESCMAMGQLRHDDPLQAADILIALCRGPQYQALSGAPPPSPAEVETAAINVVQIFLRAYAPLPDRP